MQSGDGLVLWQGLCKFQGMTFDPELLRFSPCQSSALYPSSCLALSNVVRYRLGPSSPSVTGARMGWIERDIIECMQSRQDHIIAFKEEEKRQVARKIAQGVQRRVEFNGVMGRGVLVLQHVDNACSIWRSYKARRYWYGSVARGAVMVRLSCPVNRS